MAEDWIKIDKKLAGGPKMIRLVELTGLDSDTILGRLVRFWAWVDDHVKDDALLRVARVTTLCNMFGGDEDFWRALADESVMWLCNGPDGFFIPEWDKWFSKSAKQRSANAERQRAYRERQKAKTNGKRVTHTRNASVTSDVTQKRDQRRGDKRRRDKTREDSLIESSGISNSSSAPTSAPAPEDAPAQTPTHDAHGKLGNGQPEELLEPDWRAVAGTCQKVRDKLGASGLTRGDRELIIKAAALLHLGKLSEAILWDSIEAVRIKFEKPDPPRVRKCGYWHGTLKSMCQERSVNFNALLTRVQPPDWLVDPTSSKPPP